MLLTKESRYMGALAQVYGRSHRLRVDFLKVDKKSTQKVDKKSTPDWDPCTKRS